MPRGVTDQFLRILANERRTSLRTVFWMAGLSLVAYVMAELTDRPLVGAVVWLALASLVLGLVAGAVYGWRVSREYNESLRSSWNAWMRMSLSCARVDEVARHVDDKHGALPLAGVGWTALFLANGALFAALWAESSWAIAFGAAVTVANGLVLGALTGRAAWSLEWARRFSKALQDMLRSGELAMWGEV